MIPEMQTVPVGGVWSYLQKMPNNTFRQFVAATEEDLIEQVRRFRMQNNLEMGNVESDVKRRTVPDLPDQRSLRERVTGWVANRMYLKPEFVEIEEAERRAKICVDCKFNQTDYADSCLSCHAHTEQDAFALRQGRSTTQDNWLGACSYYNHHNRTAVHLAEKSLLHRNQKPPPDVPCWMKKLDEKPAIGVE